MIIVCTYSLRTEKKLNIYFVLYFSCIKNIKNQQHQNKKKVSKVIIQQKKSFTSYKAKMSRARVFYTTREEPKITIFIF